MERLTIRNGDGSVSQPVDLDWAAALERLAAYEDSKLLPEQVMDMAENAETRLLTYFEAVYGIPVGRMMDLAEAGAVKKSLRLRYSKRVSAPSRVICC